MQLPTFLDDDESTLGFFGVQDGATIFMNEVDVKEVAREKAREEEQRKLRAKTGAWGRKN